MSLKGPSACRTPAAVANPVGSGAAGTADRGAGIEAVAEPDVRVDEAVARQRRLELHAQLVHVDVDRAVALAKGSAPYQAVQVLPSHDPAAAARERHEQAELAHRQAQRGAAGEREPLRGVDLERADADRVLLLLCRLHDLAALPARASHP